MGILEECKITYELEQLTPMLHFQGKETGATVRASEMKPKLDRFLAEWYDKEMLEEWKLKKENDNKDDNKEEKLPAFHYKMSIIADGRDRRGENAFYDERYFPGGYFGKVKPPYVVKHRTIKVTIICFIPELFKKIKDIFPTFIAVTNFGMRQRMGYGCFQVKGSDRESLMKLFVNKMNPSDILLYAIPYPNSSHGGVTVIQKLNMIKDFHQHLKSGVNFTNRRYDPFYDKSILIKEYMNPKLGDNLNEKKAMKAALAQSEIYDISSLCNIHSEHAPSEESLKKVKLTNTNIRYIRGLLGFAGQYEFRQVYRHDDRNRNRHNGIVSFQLSSNEVKRFASPIIYFPAEEKIYLIVRGDYIKNIINRNPEIKMTHRKKRGSRNTEGKNQNGYVKKLTMCLPSDFDVCDFFKYVSKREVPCRARGIHNFSYRICNCMDEGSR